MGQGQRTPTPVIDRFAARIALADSGCIQWLGATNGAGYAQIKLTPAEGRRLVYVHRWSYEYREAVTQRVNNLRSPRNPAALNAAKTHCVHQHPLTPDNLYISREGYRQCRECTKRRGHESYLRRTRKAA